MTLNWKTLAPAAVAAALSLGAPASAQDLKFSIPLPLSGPLAVTGQAQQAGWQHAVDYINRNGGIKGRKIDISYYDDEYKVDLGVAGFKKAAANGDLIFAGGDGTPFVRAISPENNEKYKVLMSNTGASSDLIDVAKYPYHFLVGPNYSDMVGMLYKYIKSKQGSGPAPKVAILYSASEFGRDPLEYARKQAAQMGINIVLEEETKFVGVDVTAHAIKIRNAAPDYVIIHGYAGNIWPEVVKLAREYGVKAQFMGTLYGSHPDVVQSIGPAADGYIGTVSFDLVLKDNPKPMMKIIDGYLKTWTAKPYTGYANIGYIQSWATALILRDAIGATIDAGKPLNGDNLIAAVNALKNWDGGGLFGVPISFEKNRVPYGVLYRYSVKDKDFSVAPASEWIKVD
jgi:branched-chain amino acid transport system substrate-binding protein